MMKKLEDYTLLFNPDGDALLIIDALPGEPDGPVLRLRDGKAVFQRGPDDCFEIIGLEAGQLEKLAQLKELDVMEQVEPEMDKNIDRQLHYTAKIEGPAYL